MSARRRDLAWLLVVVVAATTFIVGLVVNDGPEATNEQRIASISRQLKCLVCAGENVEDSRAPFAVRLREEVARQVLSGQTDTEIKGSIAGIYGEEVLLAPRARGANLLLWILPVMVAVVSAVSLGLAFRRWRTSVRADAADADDEALVASLRAPQPSGVGAAEESSQ
jgi:cytochrome c-type biogenesis protein CcmH